MKTIKKINLILIVASYFVVGLGDYVYSAKTLINLPSKVELKIENYWRESINCIDRISADHANGYFIDESAVHGNDSVKAKMLDELDKLAVVCKIECLEILRERYNARKMTKKFYDRFESVVIEKIAALHYMQTNPTRDRKLYIVDRLVVEKVYLLKKLFTEESLWSEEKCIQDFRAYLGRFPLLSEDDKKEYEHALNQKLDGSPFRQKYEHYRFVNEASYKKLLACMNYQEASYQLLIKTIAVFVSLERSCSFLIKESEDSWHKEIASKQDSNQAARPKNSAGLTMQQYANGSADAAQQQLVTHDDFDQEMARWSYADLFELE